MDTDRVPDFLIIGAMKAGTTTLYRDLSQHPKIFLSDPKEPNDLTSDRVFTPAGIRSYRALFSLARRDQLCGEASTAYTRAPRFSGVAQRARHVCGPDLKLIYIVRDPFERAVSHYRYAYTRGRTREKLEVDLEKNPEYAHVSDYAFQLKPWAQTFDLSSILIVKFEDYVQDRERIFSDVSRFLGVDAGFSLNTSERFNVTDDIRVSKGLVERVLASDTFQRRVKPLLSEDVRGFGKRFLLRTGTPPARSLPDPHLRDRFMERLSVPNQLISQTVGAVRLGDVLGGVDPWV
ncbi:MAG: sulfotransferase [Phenylobacterium sp.]|uniref:sulfotransferase family protein n=1 Tax=Phenylobacterium sp. TaxID=1871053 RepID=UPI0017EDA88F|nr:sulfotransferase [Phenylobacterium sp.]MBA4794632.1 sulfotransferase [Phenylobacterium sp.]